MKKQLTIPSYTYGDTSDPNIKRFLNRAGEWTHYWLVKERKFVPAVSHILSLGFNKGPRFRQYLESHTKEEIKQVLESAGDKGTRTHQAIRQLLEGSRVTMTTKFASEVHGGRQEVLSDEEWDNLVGFMNWCAVYNPRLVAHEQTVTDGESAGTFDALLVITVPSGDKVFKKEVWGQDILILADWKSSSGIWNEYKAQLAAYWSMIASGRKYEKFAKVFPNKCYSGIVRVGTKHKAKFEFEVWDSMETAMNLQLFASALEIAKDHEPEFAPKVEDIPVQFFLKIKKAVARKQKLLTGAKSMKAAKKALKEIGLGATTVRKGK